MTDLLFRLDRRSREDLEETRLAPAATRSDSTRGRVQPEEDDPFRTCFERDRDRILHSKAFRRLKHKTQVFINPEGDHVVTRLTHTLQVTQIGRSLAVALGLNEPLVEAICLGHEVGHPPFGHTGEEALSPYVEGEWAHAAQSVRVFEILEPLNLTWETLDGIRGHTWKVDPPPATPEGWICRFADRIAYLVHDTSDAIRAGVLREEEMPREVIDALGPFGSRWVTAMIHAVIEESHRQGKLAMESGVLDVMHTYRKFMFENVYLRPDARAQADKAVKILRDLVEHYFEHPEEIPDTYRVPAASERLQVLDYVAGMTDRYALRRHDELFRPGGVV